MGSFTSCFECLEGFMPPKKAFAIKPEQEEPKGAAAAPRPSAAGDFRTLPMDAWQRLHQPFRAVVEEDYEMEMFVLLQKKAKMEDEDEWPMAQPGGMKPKKTRNQRRPERKKVQQQRWHRSLPQDEVNGSASASTRPSDFLPSASAAPPEATNEALEAARAEEAALEELAKVLKEAEGQDQLMDAKQKDDTVDAAVASATSSALSFADSLEQREMGNWEEPNGNAAAAAPRPGAGDFRTLPAEAWQRLHEPFGAEVIDRPKLPTLLTAASTIEPPKQDGMASKSPRLFAFHDVKAIWEEKSRRNTRPKLPWVWSAARVSRSGHSG